MTAPSPIDDGIVIDVHGALDLSNDPYADWIAAIPCVSFRDADGWHHQGCDGTSYAGIEGGISKDAPDAGAHVSGDSGALWAAHAGILASLPRTEAPMARGNGSGDALSREVPIYAFTTTPPTHGEPPLIPIAPVPLSGSGLFLIVGFLLGWMALRKLAAPYSSRVTRSAPIPAARVIADLPVDLPSRSASAGAGAF